MANFLMIDTETMNATPDDRKNLLVYDVGIAIVDQKGKVKNKESFIVYETFFEMNNVMREAYYAKNIPLYLDEIQKGKRKVKPFLEIYATVREWARRYNVQAVVAHNINFDIAALNATLRYLTKSRFRFFFPYSTVFYDTMKMARVVWGKTEKYYRYCKEHNYMTNHSYARPRLTAEILYRYITKNENFVEAHTGLEDVLIEKTIFVACYNARKCKKLLQINK